MAPTTIKDVKCVLVTGGGGGLGRSMSESLIKQGKKVIIAGRTESKLQKTSKEIGATAYYVLDTGDTKSMPEFAKKITKEHPDLDCVINNAGVQRPFQVLGPDYDFDLDKADQEIDINIRGPMHLTMTLLPHFNAQKGGALVVNVSSVLGYNPFSVINPVYNGTKAWLHFWSMNLRTQLEKAGSKVSVVEIVPPTVATDLHRERQDPDDNKKEKNDAALSVDEFMEDVNAGWEAGDHTIGAGMSKDIVKGWFDLFGGKYDEMAK